MTHPSKAVTFYVNPLHVIYERDLEIEKANSMNGHVISKRDLETEKTNSMNTPAMKNKNTQCFFKVRWRLFQDEEFLSSSFADSEEGQIMDDRFGDYFFYTVKDKIHVLMVTFLYSINIAVNGTLRRQFYTHYSGKVPAITQFLLDHLRLGRLANDTFLQEIRLNPLYHYMCCQISDGDWFRIDKLLNQDDYPQFAMMCEWFRWLNEHFAGKDRLLTFTHFVDLKTTPLVSDKLLTVTSFAKGYSESSATVESSLLKPKYVLLNQLLDIRTLEPDIVAQGVQTYPEVDELTDYPEITSDDSYIENEKRLVGRLIPFITDCWPDDLEVESFLL